MTLPEQGTDTNQASELFELCKKVYEKKPSWFTGDWFLQAPDGHIAGRGRPKILEMDREWKNGWRTDVPLYTSDYLLEKLPSNIYLIKFTGDKVDGAYRAVRESEPFHPKNTMTAHAGTPLKALLKLTIALSEAGELNDQSS